MESKEVRNADSPPGGILLGPLYQGKGQTTRTAKHIFRFLLELGVRNCDIGRVTIDPDTGSAFVQLHSKDAEEYIINACKDVRNVMNFYDLRHLTPSLKQFQVVRRSELRFVHQVQLTVPVEKSERESETKPSSSQENEERNIDTKPQPTTRRRSQSKSRSKSRSRSRSRSRPRSHIVNSSSSSSVLRHEEVKDVVDDDHLVGDENEESSFTSASDSSFDKDVGKINMKSTKNRTIPVRNTAVPSTSSIIKERIDFYTTITSHRDTGNLRAKSKSKSPISKSNTPITKEGTITPLRSPDQTTWVKSIVAATTESTSTSSSLEVNSSRDGFEQLQEDDESALLVDQHTPPPPRKPRRRRNHELQNKHDYKHGVDGNKLYQNDNGTCQSSALTTNSKQQYTSPDVPLASKNSTQDACTSVSDSNKHHNFADAPPTSQASSASTATAVPGATPVGVLGTVTDKPGNSMASLPVMIKVDVKTSTPHMTPCFCPETVFYHKRQYIGSEDRHVEFKRGGNVSDLKTFRSLVGKYICAFLNTEGGTIYFGVTDDGKVLGIVANQKTEDNIRLAIDTAVTMIQPVPEPSTYTVNFAKVMEDDGKIADDVKVLEVCVKPRNPPRVKFAFSDIVYVRRDGSLRTV